MLAMMVLAFGLVDEFDRLQGKAIEDAVASPLAIPRESLSFAEIGNLPTVLNDSRKAVLVVKTEDGNLARMIVSPAYRRPRGNGDPLPILLVERLDTMESGGFTKRVAHVREVVLFDTFLIDVDSGQVVPEGEGGDLEFLAGAAGGPHLKPVGGAKLFSFKKSPLPDVAAGKPTTGRGVQISDFNGRFRLFANGQGSGYLDLATGEDGMLTGRMFSDQTGNSYKLQGQVGESSTNRIRFHVDLPRTRQDFDGVIFTDGKAAITGTYTMQDRTFGFVAIREGASLGVDGDDLVEAVNIDDKPGKLVVELTSGGILVAGKPVETSIEQVIREAHQRDPATWILLKVDADRPFSEVRKMLDSARVAGPVPVSLVPLDDP